MSDPASLQVGIVGCGAIVELSHAPALQALVAAGRIKVTALVDPSGDRRARLGRIFPMARSLAGIDELRPGDLDLALVASPARFHAAQSIQLLGNGVNVLCEKPLAVTTAEAEGMIEAARRADRLLAAGHFRRFFPALQALREYLTSGVFGRLQRFSIQEGGCFGWPAATPSFFDPRQAGGGVWLDLGIHVMDTLAWWLGEATEQRYADDAAGGLEANCRVQLRYAGECEGEVFLSRDAATRNRWELRFERAQVVWQAGRANELETRVAGSDLWQVARFERVGATGRRLGESYDEIFHTQLADVVEAVRLRRSPYVTGESALAAMRAVERGYATRQPLACPWMTGVEQAAMCAAKRI